MGYPESIVWRHRLPCKGMHPDVAGGIKSAWVHALSVLPGKAALRRLSKTWESAPSHLKPMVEGATAESRRRGVSQVAV
jgi:hypothetical protein